MFDKKNILRQRDCEPYIFQLFQLYLRMQNPIVAEVIRNQIRESFHRGSVCIVDKKGEIIFSAGDVYQVSYPRSALKLIQVIPLIESGAADAFGFTDEEIALMCGSHNAEEEHLHVLKSIFAKSGLSEELLQCGVQAPREKRAVLYMQSRGDKPMQKHNNCSGKHAGFLAYCKYHGLDMSSYIDPKNELHTRILELVATLSDFPSSKMVTAYDGCSAPIFSMPLYNMAVMYQRLADFEQYPPPRANALERVLRAVQKYPFMVAGTNRYCTEMMQLCGDKIIGKTGAEGIFCMSFLDKKLGMAVKIDDGKMHIQYMVAQEIIKRSGIFSDETLRSLDRYISEPIINFNKITTGELRVAEEAFTGFTMK